MFTGGTVQALVEVKDTHVQGIVLIVKLVIIIIIHWQSIDLYVGLNNVARLSIRNKKIAN